MGKAKRKNKRGQVYVAPYPLAQCLSRLKQAEKRGHKIELLYVNALQYEFRMLDNKISYKNRSNGLHYLTGSLARHTPHQTILSLDPSDLYMKFYVSFPVFMTIMFLLFIIASQASGQWLFILLFFTTGLAVSAYSSIHFWNKRQTTKQWMLDVLEANTDFPPVPVVKSL